MAYTPVANQPRMDVDIPGPDAPSLSILSVLRPLPLGPEVNMASDGIAATPGLAFDRGTCVTTSTWENCPDPADRKGANASTITPPPFSPFTFYAARECDFTPTSGDRLYQTVHEDVMAGTAFAVSRQLQKGTANSGDLTQMPSLNTVATTITGSAVALDVAVGKLLKQWYSSVSQAAPAVLHIPACLLVEGLRHSVFHIAGATLQVVPGLEVSTGPGYDITSGPTGATSPTSSFAYVYLTGPIYGQIGEVRNAADPHGLNVSSEQLMGTSEVRINQRFAIAERRAWVTFDTCQALAIGVTIP